MHRILSLTEGLQNRARLRVRMSCQPGVTYTFTETRSPRAMR